MSWRVFALAAAASLLVVLARRSMSVHTTGAASGRIVPFQDPWARPPPSHTYTLVVGAVCDEKRHEYRQRLRQLYEPQVASREFLVRFMISEEREHDARWLKRERSAAGTAGAVDDLLLCLPHVELPCLRPLIAQGIPWGLASAGLTGLHIVKLIVHTRRWAGGSWRNVGRRDGTARRTMTL